MPSTMDGSMKTRDEQTLIHAETSCLQLMLPTNAFRSQKHKLHHAAPKRHYWRHNGTVLSSVFETSGAATEI